MSSIDLCNELERFFSPEETVQVLSALRQDPLIWQSLQNEGFRKRALENAGNQVQCWSPGRLGLLAVEETRPVEEFRAEPMMALGPQLQDKALQAYQNAQRSGAAPVTLREAALLALALRERRRLTGTWSGLLQEILPKANQADALVGVWRTALACLYALTPDPEEMLRALFPKHLLTAPFEWITLTCLAQPLSTQEMAQVFQRLLQGMPVAYQISVLRALSLRGSEGLSAQLASRLLIGHPAFVNVRTQANLAEPDLAGLGARALALQQMGTFYQLSNDYAQAFSLLNAAEIALKQWLAGLYLQRLNLQTGDSKGETLVLMESEQMTHLASAAGWLKNDLGVVLVSHPLASSVLDQVSSDYEGAFLQLKRALLMFETEPGLARDLAREGAAGLVEEIRKQRIPFRGEFIFSWRPQDALQILLELDLAEEALALALALLEVRPNDIALLRLKCKIYERLGRLADAIQVAAELVALEPESPAWRRLIASLHGQTGDWQKAFASWQVAMKLAHPPLVTDRLSCAQAALRAGLSAEAVTLSEEILRLEPNNGSALGLIGQALVSTGEMRQAVGYLVRATLLIPEVLEPWLALARAQQELGEPFRALETLRAAVMSVPEAPESHFALGQACLNAGLPAEALPHLKKAFQLSPETEQVSLLYGRTLRLLGHAAEARAVLERVRANWSTCPELAFEYAQVLLDLGDVENALPVFEMALNNGLPILDGHLLYAKVLLGEYNRSEDEDCSVSFGHLQQAEAAIARILEIEPENLEARFMWADLLREKGELEEALEIYRDLADHPGSAKMHWRIQWGLGRTALRLDRIDIALAALNEACQSKPDSLILQRTLAEASLKANLAKEALEAAGNALQLAPDDVKNLAWYAGFTCELGESRRAVEALQRAVQIDPNQPGLWMDLVSCQLSRGDLQAARSSLNVVAQMDGVGWVDLRRAAQAYLRLEDTQAALACFNRAVQAETPAQPDLLFEVAQLHARLGHLEEALEFSHQVLTDTPESLPAYLLQADLLGKLDRPQAALALLERALRVAQGSAGDADGLPRERKAALVEIHDRFTRLMLQESNLPAALHHAEKAHGLNPGDARLACQAAELAQALLQGDRAARLIHSLLPEDGADLTPLFEQGREALDLIALMVEIALEEPATAETLPEGAGGQVETWLQAALHYQPENPRLLLARARLLQRQGEAVLAQQAFEGALRNLGKTPEAVDSAGQWLAQAALDLQRWNQAVGYFERYAETHPQEARSHLGLARALTLRAEYQRLCQAVRCRAHSPGSLAVSEPARQQFEAAIQAAGRLVNAAEVGRWQARGQAAFSPTATSARALASVLSSPDDTSALLCVLRQLNNRAAAVQVARRHAENPWVMLQLALCYLQGALAVTAQGKVNAAAPDHAEGVALVEKVVAALPNQPLAHAAHAWLLLETGELIAARQALKKAIAIWPDEPDWHDAAGDLSAQIGQVDDCIAHHREALAIDPHNARFAQKLGHVCLEEENLPEAIEFLERSTMLDPDCAQAWLDLATANYMAGQLPEALKAAQKAGELNPNSAEALMIAGEAAISMNRYDEALEFARDAVRREPENPAAVLLLCNVQVLRNAPEEALAVLESAAPVVKSAFSVAFERAKLIRRLHGPQPALEVLERLAKEHPEEPGLLGFLARTQAECGELKSAERYAFKALRIDPNQPELTLMLGRIQRKTGQLDQAVYLLSEAIRMAPDNLDAYLELGSVYMDRRETALALEVYRQAMRVAPGDYQSYYQSGLILRDVKDYSGAEDMLRRAADLAPNNLTIRRQLVGVIALNLVHTKKETSLS